MNVAQNCFSSYYIFSMENNMNKYFFAAIFIALLTGCSPSPGEKKNIAAVTCSIMSETRNMDSADRVEKMNDAREKIGGEPFLDGDSKIRESFKYGLCQELVLNENYNEILQSLKDAERERERIAAEKLAEEQRILEEKRAEEKRLADSKPTVKDYVLDNGIRRVIQYQSKNDGGRKHGWDRGYYPSGELRTESFNINGKTHGLSTLYRKDGSIQDQWCGLDGKLVPRKNWVDTPACNAVKDLNQ